MKNKFCLSIFFAVLLGSVTVQAATVNVGRSFKNDNNDIKRRSIDLNAFFDKSKDANIFKSTVLPHATAHVTTGASGFDWFTFTTTVANTNVYVDIDNSTGGLNSYVRIEDAFNNILALNDDSFLPLDPGSLNKKDSFLMATLVNAGVYNIRVSHRKSNGTGSQLTFGQNYDMHVSLEAPVPIPGAIWLFGSAFMGLLGIRGKKK